MGSLFDGIGRFLIAAIYKGITPICASEIESFPIEVIKIRFSDIVHVGDIKKLKREELPFVDIIIEGSPCQDYPNKIVITVINTVPNKYGLLVKIIKVMK